jgi:hypothetical protein
MTTDSPSLHSQFRMAAASANGKNEVPNDGADVKKRKVATEADSSKPNSDKKQKSGKDVESPPHPNSLYFFIKEQIVKLESIFREMNSEWEMVSVSGDGAMFGIMMRARMGKLAAKALYGLLFRCPMIWKIGFSDPGESSFSFAAVLPKGGYDLTISFPIDCFSLIIETGLVDKKTGTLTEVAGTVYESQTTRWSTVGDLIEHLREISETPIVSAPDNQSTDA